MTPSEVMRKSEGRGPKTGSREPRQVREEATVAVSSGLRITPALSFTYDLGRLKGPSDRAHLRRTTT